MQYFPFLCQFIITFSVQERIKGTKAKQMYTERRKNAM